MIAIVKKKEIDGITYLTCYFFETEDDLEDGIPTFRTYATDSNTGMTVEYCCSKDAEVTIAGATEALNSCVDFQSQNTSFVNCLESRSNGTYLNTLNEGESLIENGCNYNLILQTDGNLVVYKTVYGQSNKVLWASGTEKKGDDYLAIQDDGNLVIYLVDNHKVLWASNSEKEGEPPYQLCMQSDGNLVYYDANGKAVWATGTEQ